MNQPVITAEQAAEFQSRGFVLGNRLLTDDQADEMFGIIQDIVTNDDNPYHKRVYDFKHGGRPLLHIKNMWKRYEVFNNLHQSPQIYDALRALTGLDEFHLWQDRFFYKPPASGGFHTWHQDSKYLPFLKPYTAASVWIALNDADADNGAMSMVPGSHQWGDASDFLEGIADHAADGRPLPDSYGDHKIQSTLCPVPRGYAHFHSGSTWHGSGPNWSDRPRCAIGLFFVGADVRFDGNSMWAKDYEGKHGEPLDAEFYPRLDAESIAAAHDTVWVPRA
ncbi:phytanoyl-CoA dioxygenase family protein [Micromonospora sediminicola]|uniref:phytanoyl-CoA dioxygenase family protein n=1 Tax=Micromonospora sediminicola TaxID=946078 RepID=UPI00378EA57C